MAEKDACYREAKASYKKFPSARASQAIAKCRKRKGKVRKGEKGKSLRRWAREKWVDKRTGKPCGHKGDNKAEYCRPTKVVSKKKTPKTRVSKADKQKALFAKRAGKRAPTQKTPKR
jgi:hypothetical protein|tara:strand:+ start:57 stop:407 length:351 start_codon:yes stop_codon:yes gene_type:complete